MPTFVKSFQDTRTFAGHYQQTEYLAIDEPVIKFKAKALWNNIRQKKVSEKGLQSLDAVWQQWIYTKIWNLHL